MRKLKPDHYVIYNDFGLYHYNGTDFYLKEMHLIGPSRLLWQGMRFALEIQVIGIADDNESLLTLMTLFEENQSIENGFFYELGFGNFQLIQLDEFSTNSSSFYEIQNGFTLNTLFDESGDNLLLIQGKSNIYCTDSIILVNLNFHFIGSNQLRDFEFHLVPPQSPVARPPPKRPSIIYTNILYSHNVLFSKSSHYEYNARILFGVSKSLERNPIVPSDVVLQKMMLSLNADGLLPLGYFDQTDDERIAVWDPRLETLPKVDIEPIFRRSTHFKYISKGHLFN
jgi:hypothetical protein